MSEGTLFASTNRGCYSIGSALGPDVVNGQVLEVLLGDRWVAGRIRHSRNAAEASKVGKQKVGTYNTASDEEDTVTEASEESFPASDAPAWAGIPDRFSRAQNNVNATNGFFFVANEDGSVCGLCVGMKVRTS